MAFIESQQKEGTLEVALRGEWNAANIAAIREEWRALDLTGARVARIDAEPASLDLAGAWQLEQFLRELQEAHIGVESGTIPHAVEVVRGALHAEVASRPAALREDVITPNPVELIGRTALERLDEVRTGVAFIGRVTHTFVGAMTHWRRLRPISIARHVYDTGITAIPIVALIAFLISVIIAYLSAQQLRQFGAEIFTVDLVAIAVLREMGVLLTAIIVAGRSGSAFAAELGVMQLNDEVDALKSMGVDPWEVLVLPRLIGLLVALPLLTVVADAMGLAGGALLSPLLLDISLTQFIPRLQDALAPTTFWAGLIKAPVFAALIAMVGTYRGMQVRDSSRELGRLTTVAVVESIFLVIFADAIFAIVFVELDF
jgi:phospholipid/cholesterol/gamma-HCH transport system permease protein